MDLYQILTTYNHIWSMKEILITLLILAVAITSVLFLYRKKRIKASQAITIPILIAFLLIVLGSTVFGRIPGVRSYELLPLWSYGEIFRGNVSILKEVLLNFVLLMPVGVILVFVVDRRLIINENVPLHAVNRACLSNWPRLFDDIHEKVICHRADDVAILPAMGRF